MPLQATPYKCSVIGVANDGNGVPIVTVQVKDANNVVLTTMNFAYDSAQDIAGQLRRVVERKYIADGGLAAGVAAICANVTVG